MNLRSRGLLATCLLALLFALPAGAAAPTATIDLPGKVKWHRMTSLGLVLAATDDALMLINGESGQIQWQRDDIRKSLAFNVREIEGSPVILVSDWNGTIGAKVSAQGLDYATGQTVFRTEPEPGQSVGLYPEPDGRHMIVVAQMWNEGSGLFATRYETATGTKLWRTRLGSGGDIPLHPPENAGMFNTRMDLSGHQDPVFEGDTVYLPFHGLMALDLASGAVKWNVDYKTAQPEYKRAYAAPVIDGDTIYASGRGEVYAIDKASGTVRWKSDKVASGFFKSAIIAQVMPAGDAVYIRLGGNFYNTGAKQYELKTPLGVLAVDRASGAQKWLYKGAKDGMTNLVLRQNEGVVLISDAYELQGLDMAASKKGKTKFEVPIEFKREMSGGEMAAAGISTVSGLLTGGLGGALQGGFGAADGRKRLDVPVALMPRPDGKVVVAGKQHLMQFDPATQKIDWSTYYAAPGTSGVGLAVMSTLTLVASAGTFATQAAYGSSAVSASQSQFGSLNDYATRRFAASQQSQDWSYVLTEVEDGGEKGVGLLAVSMQNGEPGAKVLLKDKEPEYAVDDVEGRLYYFNDKKQVLVYSLK